MCNIGAETQLICVILEKHKLTFVISELKNKLMCIISELKHKLTCVISDLICYSVYEHTQMIKFSKRILEHNCGVTLG